MVTVFHKFGKASTQAGRVLASRTRPMLLRFPGLSGGFSWNQPAGVIVDENGEAQTVPAPIATRRVQWTIFGLGLGATAAAIVAIRAHRRRNRGFAARLRRGELAAAARELPRAVRRLPSALFG